MIAIAEAIELNMIGTIEGDTIVKRFKYQLTINGINPSVVPVSLFIA